MRRGGLGCGRCSSSTTGASKTEKRSPSGAGIVFTALMKAAPRIDFKVDVVVIPASRMTSSVFLPHTLGACGIPGSSESTHVSISVFATASPIALMIHLIYTEMPSHSLDGRIPTWSACAVLL